MHNCYQSGEISADIETNQHGTVSSQDTGTGWWDKKRFAFYISQIFQYCGHNNL
jgi:hypothetical protein